MPACLPPACPLHFNGPGKHSGPLFISGAESSGLDVIAEGVETLADRDALTALGCTKLQGYFFGRPMPLAQFDEWRRARLPAAALAEKLSV